MKDHQDEASSVVFEPSDSYDSTTFSGPRSGNRDDGEVLEEAIAQKETKVVGCLKIVVLLVLAISATIVATTVHSYLSRAEQAKYEAAFQDAGSKIFQAIGTSLDKSFGLLDSLAVLYVSYAKMSNQTWPFVTMPDFAIRLAKILPLTDAIAVNVLPVVTAENREKWEAYSVANDY
jgi:type II secretory pathway pseudopilin PulG